MHPIIYLIIGIIIGFLIARIFNSKKAEKIAKIGSISQERTSAKQENKDKIVAYLKENHKARNNALEEFLGVSDTTTTTRYLDELEKEGIVEQIGSIGRGVEYKLKNGPLA